MGNALKKYHPKISSLLNLCDVNYMLMLKLLAHTEQVGEQRHFLISDFISFTVSIKEVTRYTSLVTIKQNSWTSSEGHHENSRFKHILTPKMTIRLYHDARMAEVISCQDIKFIKPRYDYPNIKMHLPDEKEQIQLFLKEWLQLCHQLGQVNASPFSTRS